MFYSQFILAKKGPLGTIWIAAHLERKLRKNQVADTDIGFSVDSILFPDVPIALRLSSHLLLGVVRIYSRKVNYLFDDCSEALLKIKQAFRSTAVDLPPEESTAPYHSITLPETFDLDDFELPDNEMFQGNYVDHHISTKEQITLQDTMDGVVYSTSQFGLDERFGEGDASQIGLDIDEDLFMGKVAAEENDGVPGLSPLASPQAVTPEEKDENHEGIPGTSEMMQENGGDDQKQSEIPATSREALEQLRSPFSPGLECPSPLNVHDNLACEGPLDAKDHNLEESEAADYTANGNSKSDAHEMARHIEENGYLLGDMGKMKQVKSREQSADVAVDTENVSANQGVPTPSSIMVGHVKPIPQLPECSNGHITEDGPNRVENGDVINNDPSAQLVDRTDIQCAESPSCSQVTTELEDPGRRTCSTDGEIHNNMGESCSTSNVLTSNVCPPESPDRPEVVNAEAQTFPEPIETENLKDSTHDRMSNEFPGLRACNSLRQPDMSAPGGEGPESEKMLQAETQDDCRKLNEGMDNTTSYDNILINADRSAASDLPAPEKLLSVTEELKSNDLLVVSTPEKEVHGNAMGEVGTDLLSGKKRSFTESMLTVHSLNSGESFSMNKSRRTAESVPGDDDLLSSILVGRKSSVLKLKPTPSVTEIISTKRQRSAPRASALKRKVLMDDMMVLHGDTIRQQLTSTEDIRRLRKKAPCTCPEIAMIQRQFLEEEIFNEPIFTGMSAELVSLHRKAFDLSRIQVCEDDQENAAVELGKDAESVVRSDKETQPDDMCFEKQIQSAENSELRSLEETLAEVAEMEIDGQKLEVANTGDNLVHGLDSSLPNDPVANDFADVPEYVLQTGFVDGNNDGENSLQMDVPCMSPRTLDTEPVEDTSVAGTSKGGVDAIEVNENDAEARLDFDKDESNLNASLETASGIENINTRNENQSADGIENNDLSVVDPDVHPSDLGCDEKDLTPSMPGEEAKKDLEVDLTPSMPGEEVKKDLEFDANGEIAPFDIGENAEFQEQADLADAMNADIAAESSAIEFRGDFYDVMAGNDTEFLNVDDDDVAEDNEDYTEGAEDARLPENSGWSSRTRAVSKYLQILFEKEPVQGKRVLALDNILTGKTRKEASRMFFETLVLKTKDYIHAEQAFPFDNINVKPRIKLMKSDF